jgi:hypothetical protein
MILFLDWKMRTPCINDQIIGCMFGQRKQDSKALGSKICLRLKYSKIPLVFCVVCHCYYPRRDSNTRPAVSGLWRFHASLDYPFTLDW